MNQCLNLEIRCLGSFCKGVIFVLVLVLVLVIVVVLVLIIVILLVVVLVAIVVIVIVVVGCWSFFLRCAFMGCPYPHSGFVDASSLKIPRRSHLNITLSAKVESMGLSLAA